MLTFGDMRKSHIENRNQFLIYFNIATKTQITFSVIFLFLLYKNKFIKQYLNAFAICSLQLQFLKYRNISYMFFSV